MNVTRQIGSIVLGFILVGCATTPELSQQEISSRYPALVEFGNQLENARAEQVEVLAPQGYGKAAEQYDTAKTAASRDETETVVSAVEAGMTTLQKAKADAKISNEIFEEVLQARDKAKRAGAEQMFGERLSSLDAELREASNMIEDGDIEGAKRQRPELRRSYSDLELLALKQGTTLRAQAALAQAKENDADKLAPATYSQAEEELKLAESILEIDRTDTERADTHANRATVLANRSNNIAEVVKEFDRRDFSNEDIVLWHQYQLATVSSPLGVRLNFDEPNDETVNTLYHKIDNVVASNDENQQKVAQLENELAQLESAQQQRVAQLNSVHQQQIARLRQQHAAELAGVSSEFQDKLTRQEMTTAELAALEMARESKFDRIQSMFKDDEARVYRQKNNLLLSVYGFDFPTGSAEIKPDNFALMDKIVKSIGEFDNAKVVVSGHTDITGSPEFNKNLSQQRAQNVAKFLTEAGGIPTDRVVAEGYGQTKPVASNDSPAGRALNRRVDILIVNE